MDDNLEKVDCSCCGHLCIDWFCLIKNKHIKTDERNNECTDYDYWEE